MFVSIGQGGNQLASCFWQRAHQQRRDLIDEHQQKKQNSDRLQPPVSPFFALDTYAHAILLDAEPKVVGKVARLGQEVHSNQSQIKGKISATASSVAMGGPSTSFVSPASSLFRPSNIFTEQYGRGNNWAMGYVGREGSEGSDGSLLAETMEAIRQEAERMDIFDSIVLMHSIAGGTGSGLGSRVTEEIRSQYEKQFILSVCIGPFGTGDTPLQHYNSLLCLSHLYPVVDGLILASNVDVARALSSHAWKSASSTSSSTSSSSPAMSFAGINTYLSASMADILAPTKVLKSFRQCDLDERDRGKLLFHDEFAVSSTSADTGVPILAPAGLHELVNSVVPLPKLKLMEIWSSAGLGESSSVPPAVGTRNVPLPSWRGCMATLKRFVPPDVEDRSYEPRSIGYSVYARGDSASDPVSSAATDLSNQFRKLFSPVKWNPFPMDLITTSLPRMRWTDTRTPSVLDALRQSQSGAMVRKESTRSLAVAVNRTRTANNLAPVAAKAKVLLDNKAYLHWYTRYGVEASEMQDAIDAIETIIHDYRDCDAK